MKKLFCKVCFLAAITAAALAFTAAGSVIGTGVVDADALRVRSEPSTDAATLTYLSDGTTVQVYEDLGGWYKISYESYTGYVSAEYLVYTPKEPTAPVVDAEETDAVSAGEPTSETGTITGNQVHFRTGPSLDAEIFDNLNKGDIVTVLSDQGDWCQVICNGLIGYVSTDYLIVGDLPTVNEDGQKGLVTGSCVNIRSEPSTDSAIVTKVYAGALLDLGTLSDNWYTIAYNGMTGYIRADYVKEYDPNAASAIGEDIAATALSYVGTPYVYGGASPKGFDCSGFTMYVFSLYGYSLPHSATSQWESSGTYVKRSDLQPGDLVLFCDPSSSGGKACSHVGIYIGDNQFVHAASGSKSRCIRISSLSESYYNGYYVGAKRVA